MIRWFFLPAAALLLGSLIAANLGDDPGYVLIQIAGYTLESSVAGLVLLAAASIAVVMLVTRLVVGSVKLPGKLGGMLQERRLQLARTQLRKGLTELAAGQWEKAEAELLRRVADTDEPGPNYLYAAEAAHRQGKTERRDEYLKLAAAPGGSEQAAVLLRRAQLWAEDGRHTEALSALDSLLATQPRHRVALELRMQLLARAELWEEVRLALPGARNIAAAPLLESVARQAHHALLQKARNSGRLELLRSAWQDVGKTQQHDSELLLQYARLCHEMNADTDALRLIVAELRHHWQPQLALMFGELDGGDVVRQLAKVEHWINQHGEKPELLLVAGRLCLRNRLWGRARSYFEACLRSYPSPQVRLDLGKLLLQQGEGEKAALELFREGLESSLKPETPPGVAVAVQQAPESLEAPR